MSSSARGGEGRASERWHLLGLAFALALLVAVLAAMRAHAPSAVEKEPADTAAPSTSIALPRIRVDDYRRAARDATREERSIVEHDALELALADARKLGDAHFEPLGGRELDAAQCAELLANPAISRGRLFRLRGRIESLVHIEVGDGASSHWRGRVRLEDGAFAFVALLAIPEGARVGDFVRADGMFLEIASEAAPSGWIDAPLLVGPKAVRSQPALARVTSLAANELAASPADDLWELVAFARDADSSSIDWTAAPQLDAELLAQLARDDERWVGRPLRIAGTLMAGPWTTDEGENPARIVRLTHGWLGSWAWTSTAPGLIQFVSPGFDGDVREHDDVVAQGFFVRNESYESASQGRQLAPLLVLQSLERRAPTLFDSLDSFSLALTLAGCSMVALGIVAVRRDRRQAAGLERTFIQRRDAKREAVRP